MAVIKNLGLSVTVRVDGTPLDEYDDPKPCDDTTIDKRAPSVCSKYVQVIGGAEYEIHMKTSSKNRWISKLAPEDHLLDTDVYIDGNFQQEKYLAWKTQDKYGGISWTGISRYNDSYQKSRRNFKFSAIKTVDAAETAVVQGDLQRASTMGLIRVVVFRALDKGYEDEGARRLPRMHRPAHNADMTMAEKALKGTAVSHGTTLSPAIAVGPPRMTRRKRKVIERVDEHPYAIFTFKYRSKFALQSEMIIPRAPSPDAPDESLKGLSLDEIRRLARERLAEVKREKMVKTEASGVKRDHDDAFDLTGDSPQMIPRKRAKRETIDLTED